MAKLAPTRECTFGVGHFCWIVMAAREQGYGIRPLVDWALGKASEPRSLLLRHDIDVSPEVAHRFAEAEAQLNVTSSYFVRLRARYYNPLSSDSYPHLRWIGDHGFEIGLHYEPLAYKTLGLEPGVALHQEKALLERMLDIPVMGAAAHLGGTYGPLDAQTVKSVRLLYEALGPTGEEARPRWKYLSDSARRWREGCVCEWLGKVDRLEVLIHPVWWFEYPESPDTIIQRLRRGD